MTPEETYQRCKLLLSRKKELLQKKLNQSSVQKILDSEFPVLCNEKPVIYKNILSEKITLDQFKQFAESAQCVMSQVHNPTTNGKPPEPIIFE